MNLLTIYYRLIISSLLNALHLLNAWFFPYSFGFFINVPTLWVPQSPPSTINLQSPVILELQI